MIKKIIKFFLIFVILFITEYYKEKGIQNSLTDQIIKDDNLKIKFLKKYSNLVNRNKYEKKCNKTLAFSFCSCIDVVVNLESLIENLKEFHNFKNEEIVIQEPNNINTFKDLELFFKYYLQRGAGVEKFINNKKLFDIIKRVSNKIKLNEELGGNSTTMALRSYKENCNTILGTVLSKKYYKNYYNEEIELTEDPKQEMNDYHIIIQYQKNKPLLGITPNRFNRIYLNHDIDNANLNQFQKMIKKIKNKKIDFIVLSCFQLLDLNSNKKNKQLINELHNEIKNNKNKIHIELASISDFVLNQINTKIIPYTNSIGMNEQELYMMWNYYKNKITNNIPIYERIKKYFFTKKLEVNSIYDINTMILYITDLIKIIQKNDFTTDRLHFHSINQHMICHKRKIYQHSIFSLSKGILASLNIVFQKDFDNFDFIKNHLNEFLLRIPKITKLIKEDGNHDFIDYKEIIDKPSFCWYYNVDWKCCLGLTIELMNPKRVHGLGDNISSSGLIYQSLKN